MLFLHGGYRVCHHCGQTWETRQHDARNEQMIRDVFKMKRTVMPEPEPVRRTVETQLTLFDEIED